MADRGGRKFAPLPPGVVRVRLERRVRAMRRSARRDYYREQSMYGRGGVTNWRMLIARTFQIPISRVREILGEEAK
jgi:hypothetical protein